MEADIEAGGRGVEGDERFHDAVTAAAHNLLLARIMGEISDLIKETRIESLSQPGRARVSLAGHRAIADAIRAGEPERAAAAMHAQVAAMVSDVAVLREKRYWGKCHPDDIAGFPDPLVKRGLGESIPRPAPHAGCAPVASLSNARGRERLPPHRRARRRAVPLGRTVAGCLVVGGGLGWALAAV
jgi:hypothetical protein